VLSISEDVSGFFAKETTLITAMDHVFEIAEQPAGPDLNESPRG
jgi:hypothetical protein